MGNKTNHIITLPKCNEYIVTIDPCEFSKNINLNAIVDPCKIPHNSCKELNNIILIILFILILKKQHCYQCC